MSPLPTTRVGIVTGEAAPNLSENGQALLAELRERGLSAEPVLWSDSQVDWSAFDALVVRSCWEYHTRPDCFRDWLRSVENTDAVLLNPAEVIRWNLHKFYLRDLAERGVSVLPTAWVERSTDVDLQTVLRENGWREAVVKPAVGTSSTGVWRTSVAEASDQQERFETLVSDGDVLVQEFAPEITDGERSLVFFEGSFSHAVRSLPTTGEFRSHPSYGGTTEPYEPPREIVSQATEVLQIACDGLGVAPTDLPYARVDGIERENDLLLMELELVEPYLSLDASEGALDAFADAIVSQLERHSLVDSERTPQHSTKP